MVCVCVFFYSSNAFADVFVHRMSHKSAYLIRNIDNTGSFSSILSHFISYGRLFYCRGNHQSEAYFIAKLSSQFSQRIKIRKIIIGAWKWKLSKFEYFCAELNENSTELIQLFLSSLILLMRSPTILKTNNHDFNNKRNKRRIHSAGIFNYLMKGWLYD